ncbi:MAG: hypothetical protein AABM43_00760 [Actinomycetota bacterium]
MPTVQVVAETSISPARVLEAAYDWSQPGSVKATVTDSNVYEPGSSSWEIKATPKDGGSQVEMIWVRNFRGNLFGTLFRSVGKPIFGRDARHMLRNLEKIEESEKVV